MSINLTNELKKIVIPSPGNYNILKVYYFFKYLVMNEKKKRHGTNYSLTIQVSNYCTIFVLFKEKTKCETLFSFELDFNDINILQNNITT